MKKIAVIGANDPLLPFYKQAYAMGYRLIKFPAIIKPTDGGGIQGIKKCADIEELKNAYNFAKDHSRSKTVIVEDFIDGREFSVEYLSYKGKHYFLQITDKVTSGAPHFIEMQHHQTANISEQQSKAIRDMVEKALTALKIENSPSHTEIKLNSRGELCIIEIEARLDGGHITSDLVRLSTGYDLVRGALELATGDFTIPKINECHFAGVYFYSKLAEYVGDVIKQHKDDPEVVECELMEGELPEAYSNADRMGYIIYQSDKGRVNYETTPPRNNNTSFCYKFVKVLNPFKLVA